MSERVFHVKRERGKMTNKGPNLGFKATRGQHKAPAQISRQPILFPGLACACPMARLHHAKSL